MGMFGDEGKGFLQGSGAVHAQFAGDETLEEQAAETFLVVKNKNGTTA